MLKHKLNSGTCIKSDTTLLIKKPNWFTKWLEKFGISIVYTKQIKDISDKHQLLGTDGKWHTIKKVN